MVSDPPPSRHRAVSPVTGGGPLSIPIPALASMGSFHYTFLFRRIWIDWGHLSFRGDLLRIDEPQKRTVRFVRRFSSFSANLGKMLPPRPTLLATAIDWSATWKRMRLQARSVPHASGTRSRCGAISRRVRVSFCRSVSGLEQRDSRPSDAVRECRATLSTLSLCSKRAKRGSPQFEPVLDSQSRSTHLISSSIARHFVADTTAAQQHGHDSTTTAANNRIRLRALQCER